jgi:hypothetical protein
VPFFPVDHVLSNADKALKLTGDEENDWHNLHSLGVQFEDYMTCDSALTVCGVHTTDQVLEHKLTKPK